MADTTTRTTPYTTTAREPGTVEAGMGTPMATRPTVARRSNSAVKGLAVGIATFLIASLIEWGGTGSLIDSLTFFEAMIYALVGLIVGYVVAKIDRARNKTTV